MKMVKSFPSAVVISVLLLLATWLIYNGWPYWALLFIILAGCVQ